MNFAVDFVLFWMLFRFEWRIVIIMVIRYVDASITDLRLYACYC